jgi:predicted alpha/beta-hydrolase family hydrolase
VVPDRTPTGDRITPPIFCQGDRGEDRMASSTSLAIAGYRDEPVPNRFLRQDGVTDHLAILLPGLGYTCDMPLLYYAENLLTEAGADLLRVEYAYGRRADYRALPAPDRRRWLLADAVAASRAALAQRRYDALTLVGKSLGTLAMGHLLTTAPPPARGVRAVWLTPLLRQDDLRRQIRRYAGPSLFAIGTADPHFNPDHLEEVRAATGGEAVVLPGADHGLDVPGDPIASVHAVERVVRALQDFLIRER